MSKLRDATKIDDAIGTEISFVDHPANRKSTIEHVTLAKRADMELNQRVLDQIGATPEEAGGLRKFFSWLLGKADETPISKMAAREDVNVDPMREKLLRKRNELSRSQNQPAHLEFVETMLALFAGDSEAGRA